MAEASAAATARSPILNPQFEVLAEKTHLLSELAEAIDNQFNNIMMSVSSYAELELKKATTAEKRSLEQVLRNAARATYLIQKLLAFSRYHVPAPKPVVVDQVVEGVADLLRQVGGERIELQLQLESNALFIQADQVELEQLLVNLLIHIKAAMGQSGRILVRTKSRQPGLGNQLILSVLGSQSSGKQARDQDFRPTLTLNAINRILAQMSGTLTTVSGIGFEMSFPTCQSVGPIAEEENLEKETASSKTIMVVEDDDAVRIPTTEFLKMEGFKVFQARTGAEAIHIAMQKRSPVDLLITDIIMPAMSGHEVAQELKEMYPDLKVLYMSGDASKPASGSKQDIKGEVLQKPFRLDKLNEKIRASFGE